MLESAIHQILSESTLPAELPLARIVTGDAQSESITIPYATIQLAENKNAYRSNQSTIQRASVTFNIWDDQHSRGCDLRDNIIAIFDNQDFITDSANILACRKQTDSSQQRTDGIWKFKIEIAFLFNGE